MWLTNTSIKRPVFITMVVLALIVLGLQARMQMPAERYPRIDFPYISIVTVYPGAGPQEIETLVSQPIEEAVGSTGGIKNLMSTSQDGVSVVTMEFELGTNSDAAAADVRDKLSAARGKLPDDIEEPVIQKADLSAIPIMTLAVENKSKMSSKDVRIVADNLIKDTLSKVAGVAAVTPNGGDVREVSVSIDRDRLQAYGMTIDQIAQAMRMENINLPSGSVKEGNNGLADRNYAIRTVGEFKNADEIANTRITVHKANNVTEMVRIGDIADVKDAIKDSDTITRLNGKPSVILTIQKQSDANTVEVAEGLKEEINRLNGYTEMVKGKPVEVKALLPNGVKLITTTDDSEHVKDSLHDVNKSLLEGIFLVVLIVFLFLHSGRATLIVALAIPTSLVATYLPMKFFGFSMNMMTMLALSLCVGILVDDSIVVLENIERHLKKGQSPPDAALSGRSEIGLAAITITLVDVVVFVPIAFMGGIVGQFFRQFGITVAIATLFSLFMSFTLTPMLASRMLKTQEFAEPEDSSYRPRRRGFFVRFFDKFEAFYSMLDVRYRGVLAWALENRFLTLSIGILSLLVVIGMGMPLPNTPDGKGRIVLSIIVLLVSAIAYRVSKAKAVAVGFAAAMCLLLFTIQLPLGFEFLPNDDQGQFTVSIELPAGSGLNATDKVVRQVEGMLAKIDGMVYYQSTVGSTSSGMMGGGSQGSQYALISAKLKDKSERKKSVSEIVSDLNSQTALIPGAEIRSAVQASMGGGGSPIKLEIMGQNMDDIISTASQIESKIKTIPGIIDVQNSWDVGKPELRVTVDRLRAADMGVSVAQVASALRTSIEGDTAAKFRDGGNQYDIRVQLAKLDRESTSDISNVIVGQRNGTPVYLRDVATIDLSSAPNSISRKNRQRLITVSANLAPGYKSGNVSMEINKSISKIDAKSARVVFGGEGKDMQESGMYMMIALLLAIVLVYMLMGALFESFAMPLTIMASLPQAMIGALLALMLTGYTLSIMSMIGIIMLIGLVTKNAILLVDYTNTLRERGLKRNEAVLEAGPTRLRPILMTTLAMVGGMLPTALAVSKGSEQRAPMAVAVIGGLILSTLLTLLVIPTAYTVMDDFLNWIMRILGKRPQPMSIPAEDDTREPVLSERDN